MAEYSDDDIEFDEDNMDERGDWSFVIGEDEFYWLPVEPHILPEEANDQSVAIVSSIYGALNEIGNSEGRISLSPVGPHLAPDVSSAEAVFYIVGLLYPQAKFYGDAPDNLDLGLDDTQDDDSVIN